MALQRITIESDGDGHEYIIPHELSDRFDELLEKMSEDEDDDEAYDQFEDEFGDYRTDGCISRYKLYADFTDINGD